jgi:hypothetical protein
MPNYMGDGQNTLTMVTTEECGRTRQDCPVREQVYGKDGIKDQMKEIRDRLDKIDKRLSKIEYMGMGIAAAWLFFSQILPMLVKMGQAAVK